MFFAFFFFSSRRRHTRCSRDLSSDVCSSDLNAFYSGDWYSLRNNPGWSAMTGNYGSWWDTNFHIWKCNANVLNQWYANDWPAYYWDNVYSAFEGTVEWAGWGTDGFASLGNFVVVNDGNGYRSLSAHLTS